MKSQPIAEITNLHTIKRFDVRVHLEELRNAPFDVKIRHSRDIAEIAHSLLWDRDMEIFLAFHVDAKHKILGYEEIAKGTSSACPLTCSMVFRGAVLMNSNALIVVHNHPSGDPQPSEDDSAMTKRMKEASVVLGIALLDHIVVGSGKAAFDNGDYFSFLDTGYGGVW